MVWQSEALNVTPSCQTSQNDFYTDASGKRKLQMKIPLRYPVQSRLQELHQTRQVVSQQPSKDPSEYLRQKKISEALTESLIHRLK